MSFLFPQLSLLNVAIAALATIILGIIGFTLTAPSAFNVYDPDFIEEDQDTGKNEFNSRDSGYAHFSKHRETYKSLRAPVSAQVVVLGDIGRSPRMQYHAISLAKHGARVDLVGFLDSEVHPDLLSNPLVKITPLHPPPRFLQTSNKLFFILFGPMKVIWQAFDLYYTLGYGSKPAKWMLVQNPPSIPLLGIARIVCLIRNTRLVIDWHNFGWTVLAVKLGPSHPLVRVSRWFEQTVSHGADAHLVVSNAMSKALHRATGAKALVLYDRPTADFHALTAAERSAFLYRLEETKLFAADIIMGNWRLVVSPTSWTPDEDFSMLLQALVKYCETAHRNSLPKLMFIITGKGPQKDYYVEKIKALSEGNKLLHVAPLTAWLSRADYALLLGAADLGISLHRSTSGVDLPMKIVDMFGAGLPAIGWCDFEAWPELVKEGVSGKGFTTAEELQALLENLFRNKGANLELLKKGALGEGDRRWDDEWDAVAGKLFQVVKLQAIKQQ